MILEYFRRRSLHKRLRLQGARLYVALAQAARTPDLYQIYGVPDTVDGRLETLMLIAGLGVDRLSRDISDAALGRELARVVSEAFFDDMDRTFREMGIKDIGVPRKVRTISKGFYGRMKSYVEALHKGDENEFATALRRNFFAEEAVIPAEFERLPPKVRLFYADLLRLPLDQLMADVPILPMSLSQHTEFEIEEFINVPHP